ncbi:MAG TPA: IucA/IucC family C-terminal-domain containing protein [Micromonosporaceae bacterium]|nr:IucA/IucC family C-terminal-domain containing protein [Micromonosporaceae bacterium]
MRQRLGEVATHGLHPGLLVPNASTAWSPATRLTDGSLVPALIETAQRRWGAQPHAAAALAWKSYTYWLALPAVAGFVTARRVPLLRPADVLVQVHDHQPFVTIGVRRATVAVLPSDPLAMTHTPGVRVARDEASLLGALRATLFDAHLAPLLDQIQARLNLGRRTLLGSLASGMAYGVLRTAPSGPAESTVDTMLALLTALGVADLVELTPTGTGEIAIWRRTCCLAFTLPEPKVCAGCCIRPRG